MNHREYEGTLRLLNELDIMINEKEHELSKPKKQEKDLRAKAKWYGSRSIGVYDRDGTPILIGDDVIFLTKGLHSSKKSVVFKISSKKARVTSKDKDNKSICRAPNNLRVVSVEDVE